MKHILDNTCNLSFLKAFFTICFLFNISLEAQETQSFQVSDSVFYTYKKPTLFETVKYIPKNIAAFGKFTIQKENMLWTGLALGSTGALIPIDQPLTDASIEIGDGISWDKDHSYSKVFGALRIIPNDINSAVYYIGNGGTTMLLSGTFYAIGKLGNDYRALNTSSELIEVLLSVGVVTQTIKRITGRQSPSEAFITGNSGGHWTPFPSFKAYQTNTPNYDAMPSGHVATFMATLTVISTNYPEIKWIKPVGYSLLTIMAFEMVSSKVHWVSDYPLAILIGHVIGKTVANRRIVKEQKTNDIGARIKPKFKTDFNFQFNAAYKTIGATISF